MPSTRPWHVLRGDSVRRGTRLTAGLAAVGAGALIAAAPAAADAPQLGAWLYQGTAGANVARLQHALHIHSSGHFDPRTKRAVVRFQRKDGLTVDGVVGPQTWDALFHITPPPPPPAPAPQPATAYPSSTTSTASASYSSGGYSIPSSIVQCESGGNYSAVNPSSGAGGAYQILPSTWAAYGGQGLPQNASPAEQNQIAAEIYARQGGSAWTC